MSTICVLLLLVAMVLLVWGVANPASVSKFFKSNITRKNAAVWFGGMSVLLFVLVGMTSPEPSSNANLSSADQSTAQAMGASTAQADKPTVEIVTEEETIPFEKTTTNSSSMLKGTSQVTTIGVNGVKTITYEITKLNGSVTKKSLVKEEITTQPINEVTSIGTKVAYTAPARAPVAASSPSGSCDPNYGGACVPIASDVDCAGGSGNGPAYVTGPVTVIGNDIYDLDRDGNGYGCE